MNEITTKKVNIILGKMTKKELCEALGISKNTLYKYIKLNKWGMLHTELINFIYGKINKDVKKICYESGKIQIYTFPIKNIYAFKFKNYEN